MDTITSEYGDRLTVSEWDQEDGNLAIFVQQFNQDAAQAASLSPDQVQELIDYLNERLAMIARTQA